MFNAFCTQLALFFEPFGVTIATDFVIVFRRHFAVGRSHFASVPLFFYARFFPIKSGYMLTFFVDGAPLRAPPPPSPRPRRPGPPAALLPPLQQAPG